MVSVIRSLIFYAVFYPASALFAILSVLAIPLGAWRMRVFPHGWSYFHHWCVTWILGITIRYEGVRPEGPAFYALKHESFFDAIELPYLIHFPAVFAKEELFRIPFWGRAALVYGNVPVYRDQGASALRKMLKAARQRVADGRSLAIFPEGTRIPHGERPPLRSGFAGIYKMVGLPVVPVAIDSGPLYQRRWKTRGTITIKFGDIIPPGLPREEVEARTHAGINALNN